MKKITFLTLLLLLVMCLNSTGQTLTNNIVSYWKFDGSSFTDAAGSNTGTIYGAASGQSGKIGTAYSFDGTNDYVSIPNSTSLNIQSNTITLSAWVYPTANKHSVVVSKIHNAGTHVEPYFQYNLQFFYVATPTPRIYPRFCLSIGGVFRYAANTSLAVTLNQWHHLVGVYNGSTMKLYLDGIEVNSTAQTGNIDSYNTPVYISEIGSLDGSEVFQGRIDEIGIWNRELSVSEVGLLYNGGVGIPHPYTVYNYTASASPTAGGTVTMSPPGGQYPSGTQVTLTATTNSGYNFIGWNGSIMTNPYTVTVTAHSGISAVFNTAGGYTFNSSVTPVGAGTITPGNGTTWTAGVNLTVTATANPGYAFSSWQAPYNGNPNPFTLTMDGNKAAVANFNVLPVPPTVSTNTTVTSITKTTAVCGGNVTAAGTATVTARGICWSILPNPVKSSDNFTSDGQGTGSFSSSITGLTAGTLYYLRAYATSSAGTSYGTENVSFTTLANTWVSSGDNIYYTSGNVGIGIDNPLKPLHVYSGESPATFSTYSKGAFESNDHTQLDILAGQNKESSVYLKTTNSTGNQTFGGLGYYHQSTAYYGLDLYAGNSVKMRILENGSVGIGTLNPDILAKLTVNGKIKAKEIEVTSQIASDYVFEPEYKLMPLTELELYLRKNKHLPEIPSASEFSIKGQNLGQMDDMLLRKIEELTLYILKQEKAIKELRQEIDEIKSK